MPQVVELAGYTQRVATMLQVFDDCSAARSHGQPTNKQTNKQPEGTLCVQVPEGGGVGGVGHHRGGRDPRHGGQGGGPRVLLLEQQRE